MNSHQQVIKKINEYSIAHTPFFMMVDFEMQQPVLLTLEELASQHIAVSFPTYTNQASTKKSSSPTASIDLHTTHSMPKASYQAGYDKVMKALKYGNSYLTNYTGKTKIETDATLLQIFNQAQARYKICYQDEWGRLSTCSTLATIIRLTVAGLGISILSPAVVRREAAAGEIVPIAATKGLPAQDFLAVLPSVSPVPSASAVVVLAITVGADRSAPDCAGHKVSL